MRSRRLTGTLSVLAGAALLASTMFTSVTPSFAYSDKDGNPGQADTEPAGKVIRGPSVPKPTDGKPTREKPTVGVPKGAPPADLPRPPMPTQGKPSGPPPAGGVPSSERPTEGIPGPNKPAQSPGVKPTEAKPSAQKPDAIPGPKPTVGTPKGAPPTVGNPSSPAPVAVVKVRGLLTISDAQFQEHISNGHSPEDVVKADRMAANGNGTVAYLLGAHASGITWADLARGGNPKAPKATELRRLLADSKNTQLKATVEEIGSPAGLSADQVLNLMGDQFDLSDLHSAVSIAVAANRSVQEVLSLKKSDVNWGDLAKQIKPGKK